MNTKDFEQLGNIAMSVICEQDYMDQPNANQNNQSNQNNQGDQPASQQMQSDANNANKGPLYEFKANLCEFLKSELDVIPYDQYMSRYMLTALASGVYRSLKREQERTIDDYRNYPDVMKIISFCSHPINCRSLAIHLAHAIAEAIKSIDVINILMNTTDRRAFR